MDLYFRKTRRPIEGPIKRPPLSDTPTPPTSKIRASTPENARLMRPRQPPPIRKKTTGLARRNASVVPELNWSTTLLDKSTSDDVSTRSFQSVNQSKHES